MPRHCAIAGARYENLAYPGFFEEINREESGRLGYRPISFPPRGNAPPEGVHTALPRIDHVRVHGAVRLKSVFAPLTVFFKVVQH